MLLVQELRDALKGLRQSVAVALTIVACLGFGMGSVTLVYSWYEGLIDRPLPAVRRMDGLVTVRARPTTGGTFASLPEYRDWRDQATSLSGLAASTFSLFGVSFSNDSATEPIYGIYASANYFAVLGVEIPTGRDFRASDDSPSNERLAVIVSDRLWRGHLGERTDVVGLPIQINGQPGTIVGVAPRWFGGTLAGASFDLWVPLSARASLVPSEAAVVESRSHRWLDVIIGRRHSDVTLPQVRDEFAAIASRMVQTYAESRGRTIEVVPLDTGTMQQLRPLFTSVLALTSVVLLIVCSNVANLLLVRGATRVRTIAIRFALGATRAHVVRTLMLENTILAAAGAAVGLALTAVGRYALIEIAPTTTIPLDLEPRPDLRVLVFMVGLTSATVLLFGVLPAIMTTRVRITEALAGQTRGITIGRTRVRNVLVSAQFALSLTTLVGGTLFLKRAQTIEALDRGFADPARVLLIQSESALAGYLDLLRWERTQEVIADRVRNVPGVRSATWATFVPLGFVGYTRPEVEVEGYTPRVGESMRVLVSGVGDGYFDLMGVPILEGRPIGAVDSRGRSPVAVVNEAFTRRFWGAVSPLGRRITIVDRTLTVVGVAKNGRYDYRVVDESPEPIVYYSIAQTPGRYAALHVRTDARALASAPAIRRAILAVDPGFTTLAPISLEDYVAGPLMPLRMGLTFLGVLGFASLVLSAMGLQAIVAYGVTVRTREIGIRLTLGASQMDVAGIFLRQTIVMTGAGVAGGLACAAAIMPVLQQRVGYLGTIDHVSIVWPVGLLTVVGLAAGYVTAWGAARVDPAHTLRSE
jgi:predicted permease